jgi:hypothetical protein
MNTDMLRQVAAVIELEPERFDMTQWLYVKPENICGTAGCIAGTTVLQDERWCEEHKAFTYYQGQRVATYDFDDDELHFEAEEMLGLDPINDGWDRLTNPLFVSSTWWAHASRHLGLPVGPEGNLDWITAKHAATVLYALADGTITIDQFEHDVT